MAHEISINSQGQAECFFAMKPAWHGLGTVLDHAPTSGIAIEQAKLDWRVSMRPVQTTDGLEVPGTFATVRDDTNTVLGTVSDRYKIIQNTDGFKLLDSLVADGSMVYESAGALKGGRLVWMLGRFPDFDEIAEGDNSVRYCLFTSSHDGSAAWYAIPTSVRVVCANTRAIAIDGHRGFRHNGDIVGKLDYARKYLSQFNKGFTLYRDSARLLAQRRFTNQQAKDYIERLFPAPDAKVNPRAATNHEKKLNFLRANYRNERQNIASIKGTWWSLLNGITEMVDHDLKSAETLKKRENHFLDVLQGQGADLKERAFNVALEMSA